ncbi:hypothetical protein JHK85_023932 [Glycine max]|nr:hypothetical protein JHK85_023932 [Glycine max]
MGKKLMHAVQYDSYGGGPAGLKHVEVPLPTPSKDEVLIKVEAAGLNPFDWKVQKRMTPVNSEAVNGKVSNRVSPYAKVYVRKNKKNRNDMGATCDLSGMMLKTLHSVIGTDIVGEVMEVGQGVRKFKPGLTALQALTKSIGIKLDGSGERKNILVTAASGGVGHYAVQLAKLGNTHVTATCGARNIELVKSLGADEVIDYKTPDGAALKSPSGKKYDAVIHCVVGFPWSTFEPNLTMNGKVVDISPSSASMLTFALKKLTFSKKQLVPLLLIPKGEDLQYLIDLVKEGKLKTVVDSKYPLTKAEDAWAKSIDGHATGKIIIEF